MVRLPSRRGGRGRRHVGRALAVALAALATACSDDNRPSLVPIPTTVPTVGQGPDASDADPTCAGVPVGVQDLELEGGGAIHPVRIAVPSTFRGARVPVVVNWHGLGSDGAAQAQLTGLEALADAEGFIAVHPTGVPNAGDPRSAWQLTTSPPDLTHDDLAFARVLIDELVANWCADSNRIYMMGMSMGGFFTSRLLCELGDRVAAALSVGGLSHPDGCAPARPVPYLAFHGTADDLVPWNGDGQSVLAGTGDLPAELFTSVIPAEFGDFAVAAGCDATPAPTPFGAAMVRHTYAGCDRNVVLSLVEMVDGGHIWPLAPDWPIDATVDGWAFLSQFRL